MRKKLEGGDALKNLVHLSLAILSKKIIKVETFKSITRSLS